MSTKGKIVVNNDLTPLPELGSGHPDLTGWENILINGLILGKYDDIIEFSEFKGVIDRPIRIYYSRAEGFK